MRRLAESDLCQENHRWQFLKHAELGLSVTDLISQIGISEQTFYLKLNPTFRFGLSIGQLTARYTAINRLRKRIQLNAEA